MIKIFRKGVSRYLRKRALKQYVHKLAPLLARRYAPGDQYTVGQIERTIIECSLNARFIADAIALFRFEASPESIERHQLTQVSLDQRREEVAALLGITPYYTAKDIRALGARVVWRGGQHTNWQANRHGKTGF